MNSYAAGESCAAAYTVVPDENFANQNYWISNTDKSVWFSFVANYNLMQIYTSETSNLGPYTHTVTINFYSGSCTTLNLLQTQTFGSTPQGERSITLQNLIVGQSYYIKVVGKNSLANINAAFNNLSSNSAMFCVLPNAITLNPNSGTISSLPISTFFSTMQGTIIAGVYTFTGKNYLVGKGKTIVIDNNTSFINCNFIMWGTGSRILVESGSSHTFTNCYIGGCNNMWTGIQIGDFAQEGSLSLINCLIEDGTKAVDVLPSTIRDHYTLNVESTIFNKNLYSIYAQNTNVLINIKNSVFTSRNLYTSVPTLPAVAALKPGYPNTSNVILNFLNFGAFSTNLKSPNTGITRSLYGIKLVNCNFAPGYNSSIIGTPTAGSAQYNVFDNLDYGIDVSQSVATIQNNVFAGHDGNFNTNFSSPYANTGIGIVANGSAAGNTYNLIVGGTSLSPTNFQPNHFVSFPFGGFFHNFSNLSVINNTSIGNINHFVINPSSGGTTTCSHNKIRQSGTFGVRVNLTNANHANLTIANNAVCSGTAIDLINSANGSLNTISVFKNTVFSTLADNGIHFSAINGLISRINENVINFNRGLGSTYGIRVQASDHVLVHDNTIIGNLNNSTPAWTSGVFTCGIDLETSTECNVNCNYIGNVDRAIVFNGGCLNASGASEVVFTNEMRNCYDGLALENNGKIGVQGTITSPADNLWSNAGSWIWHAQTIVDNTSNGSFYKFYVRNTAAGSGYNPLPNLAPQAFQFNAFTPSRINGSRLLCAPCIGPNCNNASIISLVLQDLIKSEADNPELSEENEWFNKKYALEKLLNEASSITTSDSILTNFADSAQQGNLGEIVEAEQKLKQEDFTTAKLLCDNLYPENQLEVNFKIYNSIYAEWLMNPFLVFTDTQINDLNFVASQCYYKGGKPVLQARGFLEFIYASNAVYPSDCPTNERKSFSKGEKKKNLLIPYYSNFTVSLSPNPAEGLVRINANFNTVNFEIVFYNSYGQKVYSKKNIEQNEMLNINSLQDGFYTYTVITQTGESINGKLIVQKNY